MTSELASLRLKDLQEECRRHGLKTGGRKAEVLERLESFLGGNTTKKRGADAHRIGENSAPDISKRRKKDYEDIIDTVFLQYIEHEDDEEITDDGIIQFCADLGIDPEDPVILVVAWHMKAKAMCIFTKEEFRRGMVDMQCSSMDELRKHLVNLREELTNPHIFTKIYSFTYEYSRDGNQKSISVETAISLWNLLLPKHFSLLNEWTAYVKSYHSKTISKDVWMQTLEFSRTIKSDLSNFDEEGAWPILIDEFVCHMKEKNT